MGMEHLKNLGSKISAHLRAKTSQKLKYAAFETLEKRMMLKSGNDSIHLQVLRRGGAIGLTLQSRTTTI